MSPEAPILIAAGYQARRENRPLDAKAAFTQAVYLCRESGPLDLRLPEALKGLGQIERDLGNLPAALQHYREAADLERSRSHDPAQPLKLAHTVRHIADLLRESGDLLPAGSYYDEALLLYRDHPETRPLDLANTLRGLALLKGATGHSEAAIVYWQEARELYADAAIRTGLDLQPAYDEIDRQITQLSGRE
jgi:tetratricopeptide (TPR) repeat protein